MIRQPLPPDDFWETDAVWNLLDQVPPKTAGARFADDTVRAAKLEKPRTAWWSLAAPWAGVAAAAAAVAFAAISYFPASPDSKQQAGAELSTQPEVLAELQDVAETETLILAADHLDQFSDYELVSLIGL